MPITTDLFVITLMSAAFFGHFYSAKRRKLLDFVPRDGLTGPIWDTRHTAHQTPKNVL